LLIEVCVGSNARANLQKFLLLFQKEALSCLLRVNLYAAWYYSSTKDSFQHHPCRRRQNSGLVAVVFAREISILASRQLILIPIHP